MDVEVVCRDSLWARLMGAGEQPGWWRPEIGVPLGVLTLMAVPAAVRATSSLDRRLARMLLGPSPGQHRVRTLQRARIALAAENSDRLYWIERDLHDGTQAELVALAITLALAEDTLDHSADPRLAQLIAKARTQTDDSLAGLRRITHGFNPIALNDGLAAALPTLTETCPIPVNIDLDLQQRPDPAIERVVYFCVAELLTNITKHSHAGAAAVGIRSSRGKVTVTVTDDGRGGASPATGSGLTGLADRLETVDGTLGLTSPLGGPTTVTATLPTKV